MAEEQMVDITNQPVVIDNGSGLVKAGFAGDDLPKCSFFCLCWQTETF